MKKIFRKQTAKWTMRNGYKIRLCDMANSHLENCIRLVERAAKYKKNEAIHNLLSFPIEMGDETQDAFDGAFDECIERIWTDYLPNIYESFIEERNRRQELAIEKSTKLAQDLIKRLEQLWPSESKKRRKK